jgi:hypothetical protein
MSPDWPWRWMSFSAKRFLWERQAVRGQSSPAATPGTGKTPDIGNETLRKAVTAGLTKLDRYHRYADETSAAAISIILGPRCMLASFKTMGWIKRDTTRPKSHFTQYTTSSMLPVAAADWIRRRGS